MAIVRPSLRWSISARGRKVLATHRTQTMDEPGVVSIRDFDLFCGHYSSRRARVVFYRAKGSVTTAKPFAFHLLTNKWRARACAELKRANGRLLFNGNQPPHTSSSVLALPISPSKSSCNSIQMSW